MASLLRKDPEDFRHTHSEQVEFPDRPTGGALQHLCLLPGGVFILGGFLKYGHQIPWRGLEAQQHMPPCPHPDQLNQKLRVGVGSLGFSQIPAAIPGGV